MGTTKLLSLYKCLMILGISLLSFTNVFAQQKTTYTVKAGDTLFSISKNLNVTITELKNWNDLQNNELSIGQILTIFKESETTADTTVTQSEPPIDPGESLLNVKPTNDNTFYVVKSGDNLTTIARKHSMTVIQLKELNGIDSDLLSIGQRLTVKAVSIAPSVSEFSENSTPQGQFALYTVEAGETVTQLLERFKMTEKEFQALNPEVNLLRLARGQKITVLLPPSRNFPNPYLAKADLQDLGTVPASKYEVNERGNTTTNGELYNSDELTAAHSNIALGSILFIENPENGKGIYIRINDRTTDTGLKLSQKAYEILGFEAGKPPSVMIYVDN